MDQRIDFTQEDYLEQKGINFQRYVTTNDLEIDEYFEVVKNNAYRRIADEINKRSTIRLDLDNLDSWQYDALKLAIMDLIEYTLNAFDTYAFNGYNPDGSRIMLCPYYIIENLRSNGFIHSKVGRKYVC